MLDDAVKKPQTYDDLVSSRDTIFEILEKSPVSSNYGTFKKLEKNTQVFDEIIAQKFE